METEVRTSLCLGHWNVHNLLHCLWNRNINLRWLTCFTRSSLVSQTTGVTNLIKQVQRCAKSGHSEHLWTLGGLLGFVDLVYSAEKRGKSNGSFPLVHSSALTLHQIKKSRPQKHTKASSRPLQVFTPRLQRNFQRDIENTSNISKRQSAQSSDVAPASAQWLEAPWALTSAKWTEAPSLASKKHAKLPKPTWKDHDSLIIAMHESVSSCLLHSFLRKQIACQESVKTTG